VSRSGLDLSLSTVSILYAVGGSTLRGLRSAWLSKLKAVYGTTAAIITQWDLWLIATSTTLLSWLAGGY
jgi:hypothetical protein